MERKFKYWRNGRGEVYVCSPLICFANQKLLFKAKLDILGNAYSLSGDVSEENIDAQTIRAVAIDPLRYSALFFRQKANTHAKFPKMSKTILLSGERYGGYAS